MTLRFPDGTKVQTLEDLRAYCSTSDILLDSFQSGALVQWLEPGAYHEEAKRVSELSGTSAELEAELNRILGLYSRESGKEGGCSDSPNHEATESRRPGTVVIPYGVTSIDPSQF